MWKPSMYGWSKAKICLPDIFTKTLWGAFNPVIATSLDLVEQSCDGYITWFFRRFVFKLSKRAPMQSIILKIN